MDSEDWGSNVAAAAAQTLPAYLPCHHLFSKRRRGGRAPACLPVRHQPQARGRRDGRHWGSEEGWLWMLTVLLYLLARGGEPRQVTPAATRTSGGGGGHREQGMWQVGTPHCRRRGLYTTGVSSQRGGGQQTFHSTKEEKKDNLSQTQKK